MAVLVPCVQRTAVGWLWLLTGFLVLAVTSAVAVNQASILVVISHNSAPYTEMEQSFKQHLLEQKAQVTYIDIPLDGQHGIPSSLKDKILGNRIALAYCLGAVAYKTAQSEIQDVPTVAGLIVGGDEVVRSGNSTGVILEFPVETQLEWLKRILPHHRTIGVIYNEHENKGRVERARAAARRFSIEIEAVGVQSPRELPAALEAIMRRVDVLWGLPDAVVLSPQTAKAVLLASFQNRVPLVGISGAWVKAGALFALDWDYQDMGVQTAEMALAILRGNSVTHVPVSTPRKIGYVLNLKTAEHMKINLPSELIAGAVQVIR